jgi:hypothetical protein
MPTRLFTRVRKKAAALAERLKRLVRGSEPKLSNETLPDPEKSIAEFDRLSGSGHSDGRRFDRDEAHRRR